MNFSALNRRTLNGSGGVASWVKQASALGLAGVLATGVGIRIQYGAGSAAAGATSSAAPTHQQAARGTNSTGCASVALPHVVYFGVGQGNAGATGQAVVLRIIQGSGAADATCTASAIIASKLGEGNATATATVIAAEAHRVKYGAALQLAGTSVAQAIGTRIQHGAGSAQAGVSGHAEVRIKRSGQTYWHDEGTATGNASATASDTPGFSAVIAGFGGIASSGVTSSATAHLIRPGASLSLCGATAPPAPGLRTTYGTGNATAGTTGTAPANRITYGTALVQASATGIQASSRVVHQGHADVVAGATGSSNDDYVLRYKPGAGLAAAGAIATGVAKVVHYGEGEATATAQATGTGFSNAEVRAPENRTMYAEMPSRSMQSGYQTDRLMFSQG